MRLLFVFLSGVLSSAQTIPNLQPGTPVSGSVAAEKIDRYLIHAGGNQIIHLVVKAAGVRPQVYVNGPRRRLANSMGSSYRARSVDFYWQATDDGVYTLFVRAPAHVDAPLSYVLLLEQPHDPMSEDQDRMQGDLAIEDARKANQQKNQAEAVRLFESAAARYIKAGDTAAQIATLREQSLFEDARNNPSQALALVQKATSLSTADSDPWELGVLENAIAFYQVRINSLDQGMESYKKALATRHGSGDAPGEAQTLGNIGDLLRRQNHPAEAAQKYGEAVDLYRKAKDQAGQRNLLSALAFSQHDQAKFAEELISLDRSGALAVATKSRVPEANLLFRKGTALASLNRFKEAIVVFQNALLIFEELKDPRSSGNTLQAIARAYQSVDDIPKAKETFERALAVRRTADDRGGISQTLTNLAQLLDREGDVEDSRRLLTEAVQISTQAKDDLNKAYALQILGESAARRREFERAIEYLRQSVETANGSGRVFQMAYAHQALARRFADLERWEESNAQYEVAISQFLLAAMPAEKAKTLVELGRNYAATNLPEKARSYYDAALAVSRELKDRNGEAGTLREIAIAQRSVNEYDKAIESSNQALAIYRSLQNVRSQASTLNDLALTYEKVGSKRHLDCLKEALALLRPYGHSALEATVVHNLGFAYDHAGDGKRAVAYLEEALAIRAALRGGPASPRAYYNLAHALLTAGDAVKSADMARKALAVARDNHDRAAEWRSLRALSAALRKTGPHDEVIKNLDLALSIAQKSADGNEPALVWRDIGTWYQSQRDYKNAVAAFESSAASYRLGRNRQLEADSLGDLSSAWNLSGQPRVAVVYGKQAVNLLQNVRTNVDALEEDVQTDFLVKNEHHYRDLADLLISLGRLPEAREVLELLKAEEYRDFVGRDESQPTGGGRTLAFSPDEREFTDRYAQLAGRLVSVGRRRSELLAKLQRTTAEESELTQLERDVETGNAAFLRTLDTIAASFSAKPEAVIKMNLLRESEAFKEDLADLKHGAVIIYTLVAHDRYRAILVTPAVQKAYEYPITSAELSKKIFQYREALQDPYSKPLPLTRELYDILVGPQLAEDLKQANAQTIMWSLDGVLRYVSMAALYDGSKYLVETYNQVIFTPASNSRWKDAPKPEWSAAGFGVTKSHGNFPALPGVASELSSIIGPVLPGQTLIDEAFTTEAMRGMLRQGYPVVHLASHFKFEPGSKSSSYLLMGDGSHLTVADMERMNNLFSGVDLITLSACNTGVGDLDSEGKEVEGLGTLAQRKGAKAVVASLWPVADSSTSAFMQSFYNWRKTHPGATKVEAMRQAQVALLKAPSDSTFRHPYFWAPFFLMGNWL